MISEIDKSALVENRNRTDSEAWYPSLEILEIHYNKANKDQVESKLNASGYKISLY